MQDDPVTYQPPRRSHSIARWRSCSSMAALTSGVMGAQPRRAAVRISTALSHAMARSCGVIHLAAAGAAALCLLAHDELRLGGDVLVRALAGVEGGDHFGSSFA